MFTFTASRTSGEVQHNFGDTSLHSRFGSQHFGRFPAICGLKNVMLPETSESLKIWRGSEEYKQVLLLHLHKICWGHICPFSSFFFSCIFMIFGILFDFYYNIKKVFELEIEYCFLSLWPYRLSHINALCINLSYSPKDQSLKFLRKNKFFWVGHFFFFFQFFWFASFPWISVNMDT